MNALEMGGGEDDSVYEDHESVMMNDYEDKGDATNDELKDVIDDEVGRNKIVTEPNSTTTIEDFLEDPKQIFTITELNDLKNKERTLIERRQNVYYRHKECHKIAYEQIVKIYAPYIPCENFLILYHP